MSIPAVTQQLLAAKRAKGLSFADLEKFPIGVIPDIFPTEFSQSSF